MTHLIIFSALILALKISGVAAGIPWWLVALPICIPLASIAVMAVTFMAVIIAAIISGR